jgi:hypothetical protein
MYIPAFDRENLSQIVPVWAIPKNPFPPTFFLITIREDFPPVLRAFIGFCCAVRNMSYSTR